MKLSRIVYSAVVAATAATVILPGCAPPAPRRTLSNEEKTADMYWLFSQFNENYAPLEYKESRFSFNYEQLKTTYLQRVSQTQSNEEFYRLMFSFVSEFKDAHTSGSLSAASLPSRARIAYLGFTGKRVGDDYVVTELLPTVNASETHFPVRVGDRITRFNGRTLVEAARAEIQNFRDLGHEQANATYHVPKLFSRVSISSAMPTEENVVLTVKRGSTETQVALPWVVKDLLQFNREQRDARRPSAPRGEGEDSSTMLAQGIFQFGFLRPDGRFSLTNPDFMRLIRGTPDFSFWNTFRFFDDAPAWATRLTQALTGSTPGRSPEASFAELTANRVVPANHIPIPEARTFPAYLTQESVLNAQGNPTGEKKLVATIYVDTFSPDTPTPQVLAEFAATLEKLKQFGVRDVVIDLINNGGGSLILGMKMAQLLSRDKVVQPEIQFKVSDSWLDEFESESLNGASDAERELARRVFVGLSEDRASGRKLSRKFSVESLQPFDFVPNENIEGRLNVVLMVNEMCASMCDIFTAILKDNGLARVVGSRTMGAGGNVVNHPMAPNSHFVVRQTESLIVRKDGRSYIENNGVEPDVAFDVVGSTMEKYTPVRAKAIEMLMKPAAPATEAPAPAASEPATPAPTITANNS